MDFVKSLIIDGQLIDIMGMLKTLGENPNLIGLMIYSHIEQFKSKPFLEKIEEIGGALLNALLIVVPLGSSFTKIVSALAKGGEYETKNHILRKRVRNILRAYE